MEYDEKSIIMACRAGDSERFGELYERYINRIYAYIYYRTHHKETAEDLTSVAFFKALASIIMCDPEKPFAPWIYRIAHNTVVDHYRRLKKDARMEDAWDITDDTDIDYDADTRRAIAEVKKYMAHLTPDQRNIVILRVWEDLPYQQIAAVMGKTEESCKVAFSRAVGRLRDMMPASAVIVLLLYI